MLQSEKKINSGRGHLGWESGRIRKGTGDGRENGGGGSSKKVGKGRIMGGGGGGNFATRVNISQSKKC